MKLLLLVCLVGAAAANFHAKVNSLMDYQLKVANLLMKKHGSTRIPLGDKKVLDYDMKGAYLEDLSTLVRIGDATIEAVDDSTMVASFSIGLSQMTYGVASMQSPEANFTNGREVVGENSLSVQYRLKYGDDSCSLTWDKFQIDTLDKVTLYSDDPKYNGIDVSKYIQPVKDHLNQYFTSDAFQKILAKGDPCANGGVPQINSFMLGLHL